MALSATASRVLAAAVLTGALAGCSVPGVYVTEKAGAQTAAGAQAFDPTTFVDGIWASKVVPAVSGTPNDVATVLTDIDADRDAAEQRFGRQAGGGAPYTFAVKGSGVVQDVDTSGAVGRAKVQVDGVPRGAEVYLAVGPAFVGTAVRDSLDFVDFSQFTNQLDYADVATALNARVKADVVGKVDLASLKGKNVTFAGAFALLDPTAVVVTPVTLEVAP